VAKEKILFPLRNENVYKNADAISKINFDCAVDVLIKFIDLIPAMRKLDWGKITKDIGLISFDLILMEHWEAISAVLTSAFGPNGFMFDTSPLKETLKKFVAGKDYIGYQTLGDVALPTYISAVSDKDGKTKRFTDKNADDKPLDLVQVLMASTAIPAVFPKQPVGNLGDFIDGGTATDNFPVTDLAEEDKFDELYVLTPYHAGLVGKEVPHPNTSLKLLDNIIFALGLASDAIIPFQLAYALKLVKDKYNAFIYMPRLETQYDLLDFGKMKEQYEKSHKWATENSPKRIIDFLKDINFPIPE